MNYLFISTLFIIGYSSAKNNTDLIYCKENEVKLGPKSIILANYTSSINCANRLITEISPDAFSSPKKIIDNHLSLYFKNNSISILKANTIHMLINIDLIDVSYNKLEIIYADTFKYAKIIYVIYLNNNQIKYIEGDWNHLKELRILYLNFNQIVHFRRNIFKVFFMNSLVLEEYFDLQIAGNEFQCKCDILWLRSIKARVEKITLDERMFCKDKPSVDLFNLLTDDRLRTEDAILIEKTSGNCSDDQSGYTTSTSMNTDNEEQHTYESTSSINMTVQYTYEITPSINITGYKLKDENNKDKGRDMKFILIIPGVALLVIIMALFSAKKYKSGPAKNSNETTELDTHDSIYNIETF